MTKAAKDDQPVSGVNRFLKSAAQNPEFPVGSLFARVHKQAIQTHRGQGGTIRKRQQPQLQMKKQRIVWNPY